MLLSSPRKSSAASPAHGGVGFGIIADIASVFSSLPAFKDAANTAFTSLVSTALVFVVCGFYAVFLRPAPRVVDEKTCDCKCWDARERDGHTIEYPFNYRGIYINADRRAVYSLAWTAFYFTVFVAVVKKTILGAFTTQKPRWWFVFLLVSQLYPLVYGFSSPFNYLNHPGQNTDLFSLQLYFCFTEFANTATTVALIHRAFPLHPHALWLMLTIALTHVTQTSIDSPTPVLGVRLLFWADIVSIVTVGAHLALVYGKEHLTLTALLQRPADAADYLALKAAAEIAANGEEGIELSAGSMTATDGERESHVESNMEAAVADGKTFKPRRIATSVGAVAGPLSGSSNPLSPRYAGLTFIYGPTHLLRDVAISIVCIVVSLVLINALLV